MRLKKQEIKSFLSLEDFVDNWNSKHGEKMEIMGENIAVARGDKNLWIAEKETFVISLSHYVLKDTQAFSNGDYNSPI